MSVQKVGGARAHPAPPWSTALLVTSWLSKFFLSVHHTIPSEYIFDYLKTVLPPDTFEAFLCRSIFDKTTFCLEEKQGMLVNDECSSW